MYFRIKRGEKKVGFPRFKGKGRYKSFTFKESGFKLDKKLKISKVGDINIKLHRPIIGDIKTLTIKKTVTNKYYASFSCYCDSDLNKSKTHIKKKSVGLDVGLKSFLTTSEGQMFNNPKFYRKTENKLKRLQRLHSNKKLGSNNRKKFFDVRVDVVPLVEQIRNRIGGTSQIIPWLYLYAYACQVFLFG